MKRIHQFILGIITLLLLQIVFIGIYIDVIKDLHPSSFLQTHISNNNQKDLEEAENDELVPRKWRLGSNQKDLEEAENDELVPRKWRVGRAKVGHKDDEISPQWKPLEKMHFAKPTQSTTPPLRVKKAYKRRLGELRRSEKIATKDNKDLTDLNENPFRSIQSIIGKVISTKQTAELQSTSSKQTHQTAAVTPQKPIAATKHRQPTTHQSLKKPTLSPPSNDNDQGVVPAVTKKPDEYKTVLLYTPLFGRIPWPYLWFEEGKFFRENDGSVCRHKCKITYQHSLMGQSDAVLLHGNDIHGDLQVESRGGRTFDQRWIYMSLENPQNSRHSSALDGIFNWTCTYMRQSEVYMPYNNYRRIPPSEIPKGHFTRNYAEGKSRLIAWAVGHCGAQRDDIVTQLLKYVDVTVFGSCSSSFNQNNQYMCPRGSDECRKVFRTYKFYLSFENTLCSDYVTEKYWETPLENEMVPIVFGANYDDKNSIPGSYINVLDFTSIKSLAEYLQYLDKNDKAYNEYFQWKSRYKVQNHSWRCMLCENLYNNTLPRKVIKNFQQFWSPAARCDNSELEAKVARILESKQ